MLVAADLDLGGLKDKANRLGKELDAMHKQQRAVLAQSHKDGRGTVTSSIQGYNSLSGVKLNKKKDA